MQVPFVLLDSLEGQVTSWEKLSSSGSETKLRVDDVVVLLRHKPFQVEVTRRGDTLLTFNSRSLFQFEHLREKKASLAHL